LSSVRVKLCGRFPSSLSREGTAVHLPDKSRELSHSLSVSRCSWNLLQILADRVGGLPMRDMALAASTGTVASPTEHWPGGRYTREGAAGSLRGGRSPDLEHPGSGMAVSAAPLTATLAREDSCPQVPDSTDAGDSLDPKRQQEAISSAQARSMSVSQKARTLEKEKVQWA
jgi:hypothetical protein